MKKFASLLIVAILGGTITLGAYKYLEDEPILPTTTTSSTNFNPVNYKGTPITSTNADFTEAADRTVHAVVHVKNVQISRKPRTMQDFFNGGGELRKGLVGAGSGVIISADGYIVTNNHVIDGAAELEVSLNDNRTYKAEVIGTDPKADIALIKIDADDDLPYLPFGNSDNVRLGEWVLAVGNPFNLTSTVTAGIISAKARDINEYDSNPQSFIQTDAAINPGNSGGALVNINGELIGINTAITSQTGSYVGYAFAVPSNNARKIVEDILEYGDVQRGILGIIPIDINANFANQYDLETSEGVYVGSVDSNTGAAKAGLQEGDIIVKIDNTKISKISDLTGYLGAQRPGDVVEVSYTRDGKLYTTPVKLTKYVTYVIEKPGIEISEASKEALKEMGVKNGVVITKAVNEQLQRYNLSGIVITAIDDQKVNSVEDVKRIISEKDSREPISINFASQNGESKQIIFN
ncbi:MULTISPECIES: trypsin-like peptidase domain-containing protein [unclassified Leeuwenhoekiella]|uniref:trypsin-like peptidase domain-containing protein n=1 Tax=unclassified Leeuwenhoekiella TaxID=2615029 RepID=UPI000C67D7AE|nr:MULTISPECIES: trypsin-like peptidase domain-containing protein [unclassified Leeuwenhoekiella]MAW94639.1 serine protease [Leeuwenhoekiella sp.]MBA82062.1 serine protease [Leeuwenhoekiella sp.]|tara:strand:- start:39093 stop:40487 length:1395 start_codon:yes stop_codon:yes gene_type:complete